MSNTVDCLFCRIVAGDVPAHVVWRDDVVTAFLDARPLFPGHTLVVPNEHAASLADLDNAAVGPFFERVRWMAAATEGALGAGGAFVALNNKVSQSQPHLHVHVVPRTKGDGLRGFFWPRTRYESDAAAGEMAGRLHDWLAANSSG